jgi:chromosome partitioning protein
VAKTSTSLNLGISLARLQKKVLLIDFDVQANLTTSLGLPANSRSFFDILRDGRDTIFTSILESGTAGVHILPSNSRMALLSKHYMYRPGFEILLRERLKQVTDHYDVILIDTPPALDFCTLNALSASSLVIIPTPCEYLSMHGIHKIEEIIRAVRQKSGRDIDYRILITMYDPDSTASQVIHHKIRELFGDKVFATVIETDEKIRESLIVHQPVIAYDEHAPSALQYMELARELDSLLG